MARQTSIDCYHQIKAEGLLSLRRLQALEAMLKVAPCTSMEAFQALGSKGNGLSQIRARYNELRELGVIYEVQERKCTVTGRNVIEWDFTDKLPTGKIINTKKKKEVENPYQDLVDYMEKKNMMFISIDEIRLLKL